MGQRFQSVFILPPVFMNEGNPNNRTEKVKAYHNQWLYGRGAININLAIIQRIAKAIKKRKDCGPFGKTKQDFINHFLESSIDKAIQWASLENLHNETQFIESGSFTYGEQEKKPKENQYSLARLLKDQDNNNGFFICIITKDLKIQYAFISGLEDEPEHTYKTPQEYLNLFYSVGQLKKTKGLFEAMQRQIKSYYKFIPISRNDLAPVIKELNN